MSVCLKKIKERENQSKAVALPQGSVSKGGGVCTKQPEALS